MKMSRIHLAIFIAQLSVAVSLQAVEVPPKLPLWEKPPQDYAIRNDVKEPLHVFGKGSHGFDMGAGRGKSIAIWPSSFLAWLSDSNIIQP